MLSHDEWPDRLSEDWHDPPVAERDEVVVLSLDSDRQWTFRWPHDEGENGGG